MVSIIYFSSRKLNFSTPISDLCHVEFELLPSWLVGIIRTCKVQDFKVIAFSRDLPGPCCYELFTNVRGKAFIWCLQNSWVELGVFCTKWEKKLCFQCEKGHWGLRKPGFCLGLQCIMVLYAHHLKNLTYQLQATWSLVHVHCNLMLYMIFFLLIWK